MKKHLLLCALFLIGSLFVSNAFAQFVSGERAKKVVVSLFNERKQTDIKTLTVAGIESESLIYHKGVAAYYIFNVTGNAFVLVSADERINPILGYSFQSNFDEQNVPDCLEWLLELYKEQIYEVVSGNQSYKNQAISDEWQKYEMGAGQKSNPGSNPSLLSVTPLTTTTWSQGCYYNEKCPADASLGTTRCGRVPTGCVATAFAQVLKYYNYPAQGLGSNAYACSPYGTLSVNFGATTYNWAAMPNKLLSSNLDVAQLLYHAGVSINMGYTANSSAAFTTDVKTALVKKFKYANTVQFKYKSAYTDIQWDNLIRAELDAQRVVIITGTDPVANAGHAFIADGYQGTNSFHINWGWNGSSDGYFLLNALSPSSYSFNTNVGAIIGIKPSTVVSTCQPVTGLSANTITTTGATLSWTAASGAPNTFNVKYKPSTSASWTTVTSTSTSKSISGLAASTSYQFQVQQVCSGTSSSNYSATSTFTTLSPSSSNNTLTIGTGTGTTTIAPYGTGNMDERVQFIITKNQLVAAGYSSAANYIKSLAFNVSSVSSQTMNGFTIKIGHITAASFSNTSFLNTTMTTVYSGSKVASSGWNTHTFTSSFNYNGTSNLLIEICWNNTSKSSNSNVRYTGATAYQTLYYKGNVTSGGVCAKATGSRSKSLPNMKLVFSASPTMNKMLESTSEETQPTIQEEANMKVYPNPAESSATIQFDGAFEKAQINVFDIMGKLVFSDNLNNNTYLLRVENFPAGIYQISIQTESGHFVKKLIVQKNL